MEKLFESVTLKQYALSIAGVSGEGAETVLTIAAGEGWFVDDEAAQRAATRLARERYRAPQYKLRLGTFCATGQTHTLNVTKIQLVV